MKREIMRPVFLTISILMSIITFAQERFITIDNSKIRIKTIGLENRKEGQPIIIFENGHGETIKSWHKIIEPVANICPVFVYDRAGTGESETDGEFPSIEYNSQKLKKILDTSGIKPPYLLIGHSLGSLYIRGFANYYPEDLAGLVFVDPDDFTQKLDDFETPFREIGVTDEYIDSMMFARINNANYIDSSRNIKIQQESKMLWDLRCDNYQELNSIELPPIPIYFIVGGRFSVPPQFRSKDYDQQSLFRTRTKYWIENWTNVVNKSPYGRLFYSSKAGHYVQYDDPELVIASIKLAIEDYYKMQNNR
jgi:pimeloyl-ACP methyl ester carboxylesterase